MVSMKIKNIGSIKGDEVVQLYLKDLQSEEIQATKKLRDFKRVSLNPGESRTLEFQLDKEDFKFWSEKESDWYIEPGEFEIQMGSSSEDIRMRKIINVE